MEQLEGSRPRRGVGFTDELCVCCCGSSQQPKPDSDARKKDIEHQDLANIHSPKLTWKWKKSYFWIPYVGSFQSLHAHLEESIFRNFKARAKEPWLQNLDSGAIRTLKGRLIGPHQGPNME